MADGEGFETEGTTAAKRTHSVRPPEPEATHRSEARSKPKDKSDATNPSLSLILRGATTAYGANEHVRFYGQGGAKLTLDKEFPLRGACF
ncbi:MAG: hypothetical protein EA401_00505 [Planctomycetota bacterium]|nr:MAG: hypothetical protein EA401_00505 [Planctomycetota bacterium]